ncbi:hypothetical protein ACEQPO_21730 [Bacillus sp. SL00103]
MASIDIALDHVSFLNPDDQLDFLGIQTFSIKPKYAEIEELPLVDLLQFEKEALDYIYQIILYKRTEIA